MFYPNRKFVYNPRKLANKRIIIAFVCQGMYNEAILRRSHKINDKVEEEELTKKDLPNFT